MAMAMSVRTVELVDDCIRQIMVPAMRRAHLYEVLQARDNGGWFDARPWCVCGYSLAFDQEEAIRPHRWRHATCGSFERHRWLIGSRRMRLLRS